MLKQRLRIVEQALSCRSETLGLTALDLTSLPPRLFRCSLAELVPSPSIHALTSHCAFGKGDLDFHSLHPVHLLCILETENKLGIGKPGLYFR